MNVTAGWQLDAQGFGTKNGSRDPQSSAGVKSHRESWKDTASSERWVMFYLKSIFHEELLL